MKKTILVFSIFLLIFSSSGCDILSSIFGIDIPVEDTGPEDPGPEDPGPDDPGPDDPGPDDPGPEDPGPVTNADINLNTSYQKTIEAYGSLSFSFIAGSGTHIITLTNLTSDVDIELLKPLNQNDPGGGKKFILESKNMQSSDEKIKADLISGQVYIVTLEEFDKKESTFNLKISDSRAAPGLDNDGGVK